MGHTPEITPSKQILTIPNLLSLFRLCLIPIFVLLYVREENYPATAFVLILSGFTDIADGFIARRFHMTSDLGKVLDPAADKLTQLAMLLCLLTRFPRMAWPLFLLVVKECSDTLSGYLVVRRTGIVLGAEWHGKAATCALFAAIVLHVLWYEIPPEFSLGLILFASCMQVLSLVLYLKRNLGLMGKGKQE